MRLIVLILTLAVFQKSVAQIATTDKRFLKTDYVLSQWSMEDGLPQSSVNDMIQAKDGFIWLATFGGLVRFDGINFTTFNQFNTKGMRSDRILNIFESNSGALWIGTEDGFIKFQNGVCEEFIIQMDNQIYSPQLFEEDSEGRIWISVNGKPYRLVNNVFIEVPVIIDSVKRKLAFQNKDGIWLVHRNQILKTLNDEIILIEEMPTENEFMFVDSKEYPKHSGNLFIASSGNGIIQYNHGKVKFYSTNEGLASRYTWKLNLDYANRLWVMSYNGVSYFNDREFVPVNFFDSSDDIQIRSILNDSEGNYWIGSTTQGLFRLKPTAITTIDKSQGLHDEKMLSLTRMHNGDYLFATNCGGVFEWNGMNAHYSSINAYLPNLCIWSVFEDSKKRFWFGSKGLYQTQSLQEEGRLFNENDGFNGIDVFAISEDSKGNIWIGCLNGTYVYDGKAFKRFTSAEGLPYNDTRVFLEDRNKNVWIGTSSGLAIFKNNQIQPISLLNQKSDSNVMKEPYIRAIYEDSSGVIWVGTYGNGIFRIKEGKSNQLTQENGLFDNIVSHIVPDAFGNFWIGSNHGIFSVNRDSMNRFFDLKKKSINSIYFGKSDGMKSVETNGGFFPNALTDEKGHIYFPTVSGVTVVKPEKVKTTIEPNILITSIKNGDEFLAVTDTIQLDYRKTDLEIHYTAIQFGSPEKIKFRYQLIGLNENWFNVGKRRDVLFTKLSPGDYLFNVTASGENGNWNSNSASLFIRINPPFWQQIWFEGFIVLLFLSSVSALFYIRIEKLNAEKLKQKWFSDQLIESQENERRRIASELHDGLGQQILVIKNRAELAKRSIGNQEDISHQLEEIVDSAIRSIKDVREISHALRPIHLEQFGLTNALINLCEQLNESSPIEWSYYIGELDSLVEKSKEIHFYRVIQEALSNVEKHSKASEAFLRITVSEKQIQVHLWDDGVGFDVNKKSTGLGFIGMQERIDTLGGSINLVSEKEKGTTLNIGIPI